MNPFTLKIEIDSYFSGRFIYVCVFYAELVEKTDFRTPEQAIEEAKIKQTSGETFATYALGPEGEITTKNKTAANYTEATQIVTDEHFPNSHWLFDTPGLVNEDQVGDREIWPRGYKTFFMLNSTGHEIFPSHKC